MHSVLAGRRVMTAITGPPVARPVLLAATSAQATDPGPGAGADSGACASPASSNGEGPAAQPRGRLVSGPPPSVRARAASDSTYPGAGYVAARYVRNLATVPWCARPLVGPGVPVKASGNGPGVTRG